MNRGGLIEKAVCEKLHKKDKAPNLRKTECLLCLIYSFYAMAPTAGFEPTTDRLTADCSTAELCRNIRLAPTAGFEPTTDRLTADCSTAELCRNMSWLRQQDLNLRPIG